MNHSPLPVILAIETSCDDTAAAVVQGTTVLSNIIASQTVHHDWGGIVPELASREHVRAISYCVDAALQKAAIPAEQIDAIAVTYGPGLPGSLLVGTQYAKGLSISLGVPLVPVHHIRAHVYSAYLEDPLLTFPSISLVVSGGHTALFVVEDWLRYRMVGSTVDDAAGEAFDKVSKMLGLGYPGGPVIDKLAQQGNPDAIAVPRGKIADGTLDFSFSGLKTSVRNTLVKLGHTIGKPFDHPEVSTADICASVQRAIVEVLVAKTIQAACDYGADTITVAGGVSANSELRRTLAQAARSMGLRYAAPRGEYCIDNAAMIGFVAYHALRNGEQGSVDFGIEPRAMKHSGKEVKPTAR